MEKHWKTAGMAALALGLPAVYFYLLEFYTRNPFEQIRPYAHLFNLLLFETAGGILFCMAGRLRTAYRILGAVTMIFGIANAYVIRFRTNPIVPWDIFSLRTAASVADNYDFKPDGRMAAVTLLFLAVLAALQPVRTKIKLAVWKRAAVVLALFAVLFGFSGVLQQENFQNRFRLYNKLFTPTVMTKYDGTLVTLVMNLAYMTVDRPAGYDAAEAAELLDSCEGRQASVTGELPNIIVVMDEAFSDLAVLGKFRTNQDYMPFVHRLSAGAPDTVTGMLNVSVCGGNTANTEFEFLTGNTMAFLPQGSVPYQQYLNGESASLPGYLRELGYQTVATHPYNADGWNRDNVYAWLGFQESIFKEGYSSADRIRNYVSDESCVDKLIELYENKKEDVPLFAFCVTMQNHGGYQESFENFTPEVSVSGVKNVSLEQYLSLIRISDAALEHLVSYFAAADEKTVVVFFGDHQPGDAVTAPVLFLNGMAQNALDEEEQRLRYQVPYVIWANYDIAEEQNADTSANYLGAELLRRAGVPTDGYQNFLLELKESYPVISAVRVVDSAGAEADAGDDDSVGAEADAGDDGLEQYRKLQYYRLFDED